MRSTCTQTSEKMQKDTCTIASVAGYGSLSSTIPSEMSEMSEIDAAR